MLFVLSLKQLEYMYSENDNVINLFNYLEFTLKSFKILLVLLTYISCYNLKIFLTLETLKNLNNNNLKYNHYENLPLDYENFTETLLQFSTAVVLENLLS